MQWKTKPLKDSSEKPKGHSATKGHRKATRQKPTKTSQSRLKRLSHKPIYMVKSREKTLTKASKPSAVQVLQSNTDKKLKYAMTKIPKLKMTKKTWLQELRGRFRWF